MEITLKQYARENNLYYPALLYSRKKSEAVRKDKYKEEDITIIMNYYRSYMRVVTAPKLSFKTKLLLLEYKEKYPILTLKELSIMFGIESKLPEIKKFFSNGYVILPSKINQ